MSALFTLPKQVPLSAGAILPGAKLYFYQTGTTTPQNTYQDNARVTPHANPVVADSNGVFPAIYLDPTLPDYRVKLTTSADVLVYQQDNVPSNQNTQQSIRLQSTDPSVWFYDTDGPSNARKYRLRANGQNFELALSNDDENLFTNIIQYDGSAGVVNFIGAGIPMYGVYAKKLNDSTITSNTTLSNDSSLQLTIDNGGYFYVVEGQVVFDAFTGQGAMGAKFGLNHSGVSSSRTDAMITQYVNGSGSTSKSTFSNTIPLTAATIGDTNGSNMICFTAMFRTSTGGMLSLQAAQNSSNASPLNVRANSWIRAHRIGTTTS